MKLSSFRNPFAAERSVLVALGLSVAACGGDGGGDSGTKASSTGGSGPSTVATSVGGGENEVTGTGGATQSAGGTGGTTQSAGGTGGATQSAGGTGGTTQSAGGTGGVANSAGSSVPRPSVQSNLPASASTSVSNTAAAQGLTLVSLNLLPNAGSSLNYVEWFGEVRNTGTSLICYVKAKYVFKTALGAELWSGLTYADTLPYLSGSSTTATPCLAPGESGAFWTNDLASSPLSVGSVGSLTVEFDGLAMAATKFSQTLTVSTVPDSIYVDGKHWAMSGTLIPSQSIYNVMLTAYAKSSTGLITGKLSDTNAGTIAPSTGWSYGSDLGIEGPKPAEFLVYDEFILTSSSSGFSFTRSPSIVADPELAALAAAVKASKQAARERLAADKNAN